MYELALPILVPFGWMILSVFLRKKTLSGWSALLGSLILLCISVVLFIRVNRHGVQTLYMGAWEAPFGISLVVDTLSGLMLIVSSVIILAIAVYAIQFIRGEFYGGRFYIFFFSLVMGLNGAFITGDVFNLYVWFEVMLLSAFVLITMGSSRDQLRGGIKYMALNLLGSLFFLSGIGLLYGKTGTLNMAHLAVILQKDAQSIFLNTSAMLFFVAFGIKAAVFPLYFWLPSSYHTPNITITSLFSGLLTKVGLYTLIRFFTLFFIQDQNFWHPLLLIIAGLTMLSGGIAASSHYEIRRILSYHIISQIGYMVMGLGIFTPLGIAGAIFFTIHNMIAKTNTFLIAGLVSRVKGSFWLKEIGGLFRQSPLLAILFILPAFALAGVPPLSGFFAKFILIKAGIEDTRYIITAVALVTGLLTLYSMIKIWNEAFLKAQPAGNSEREIKRLNILEIIPSALLGSVSLLMGIFAVHVFEYSMDASSELLNPVNYIESVLYAVQK